MTQYDNRGYPSYEQRNYENYDEQGYNPYDHQQGQQSQQVPPQRPTIIERGRAVRLMKNGDPFFLGRQFVVNQKRYPMLDVFLDDASKALNANFGAVRSIYTPNTGRRLNDISEFEDHRTYVAGGKEKFKKLHYLDIAEGKRVQTKGHPSPKGQLPPIRRIDAEGRALKLSRSENMIIYIYRNGDPLTLPIKILLVKSTLQNWERVLDEITKKILLNNTAVLKLYTLNGELVTSGQQLEYNGMYVAAGKERFRRVDYPDPKSISLHSSPKLTRKSITKSDGTHTYTATTNSYGSNETSALRRPPRDDNDFFNQKNPQNRRGPVKETDLDRDDGGIYKGRTNHRSTAREIDDNYDTKIDVPVDYRNVETVEDENLYGNVGKTPRRPPPNNNSLSPVGFSDPRHQPNKNSTKSPYHDDYPSNRFDNYENDYNHRSPFDHDDDQRREQQQQPYPYSTYRSSSRSPRPQNLHEEKQSNHHHQPSPVTDTKL